MRSIVKTRIGTVPIALVAVLALAAFISAGFWLVPNGQNAEAAAVTSITIDVGEAVVDNTATTDVDERPYAFMLGSAETITVDPAVTFTGTETDDLGSLSATDVVVAGTTASAAGAADAGRISIAAAEADTPGTRTVNVTATIDLDGAGTGTATRRVNHTFTITVEQNPIQQSGDMVETPDTDATAEGIQFPAGDCVISTNATGDLDTRDISSAADAEPIRLGTEDGTAAGTADSLNVLVSGGDCTTSGSEVKVIFKNTGAGAANHLVYLSGDGSKLMRVMPTVAKGKSGFKEEIVTVPATGLLGAGQKSLTVQKSMADDDGKVYLIGYQNVLPNDNDDTNDDWSTTREIQLARLTSKSTTFLQDAGFVVEVLFLEAPDADMTGIDGDGAVTDTAEEKEITVTVMDKNGNAISGVNVDFSIVSDSSGKARLAANRKVELKTSGLDGKADVTVKSLPTDVALRVGIKVDIGDTVERMIYLYRNGSPDEIMIKGYADCNKDDGCSAATDDMPIVKGTGDDFFVRASASDEAGNNVSALATTALMVVGSDDASKAAIDGTPERVDEDDEIIELWEMLGCAEMKQFAMYSRMDGDPPIEKADGSSAYCAHYEGYPTSRPTTKPIKIGGPVDMVIKREAKHWFKVTVDDEADAGTYSVKATTGTGASMMSSDMLEFTVAGKADSYGIYTTDDDGMATETMAAGTQASSPIRFSAIDDSETYVLMVRDAAGNVPSSPDCVNITMSQGTTSALSVKDTDSAMECDATTDLYAIGSTGNVEITVSYDFGISAGTVGRLVVKDGATPKASRYFQFGATTSSGPTNSAPTVVSGAPTEVELAYGGVRNIGTSELFRDSDGSVSIQGAYADDPMIVAVASMSTHVTLTAKMAGTTMVHITGVDDDEATVMHSISVTVAEMVDMTLTAPSSLRASGGNGEVTLSWAAGNAATRHWVFGISKADWDARDVTEDTAVAWNETDASDSHTVTGLENGTEYYFWVTAGQMQDDGSTMWSAWSNVARGTPGAPTSSGPVFPPGGN